MASRMSETEKILIQNNPYYEEKYLNSRYLPDIGKYISKKTSNSTSNTSKTSSKKSYSRSSSSSRSSSRSSSSSAQKEAEKLAKEREKAEKERLALLKKQKKGAADIMDKYDKLYKQSYEDSSDAYIDGVKRQRAFNEAAAQQGLYGSGYSEEKNRELAVELQNDIADIYNERLEAERQLERDRLLDEIPLEMMEKRYKPNSQVPKKYVDKIMEQLLKDELKKQLEAQKWAGGSDWL